MPSRALAYLRNLRDPTHLSTKLTWITVLYFAEGFPFGVVYDVWPVFFRVHGVSLREIGLMALLSLPYTLKPAWAPLVDRFGYRQHWIVGCQLGLALVAIAILQLDPSRTDWLLWIVLLSFTVFSATQDIAVDAYAVDISTPRDSGLINGLRTSSARVALLVAGGGLLVLADRSWSGWSGVWWTTAGLCMLFALLAARSPRVPREPAQWGDGDGDAGDKVVPLRPLFVLLTALLLFQAYRTDWSGLWLALAVIVGSMTMVSFLDPSMRRWMFRREMLPVVAFVLLYKVGDSTLGRMVKPFWVDQGMTPTEIGTVSVLLGSALTFAGAILGGVYITRKGIYRALVWMGIAQLVSNFGYVAVAMLDLPHGSVGAWGMTFGPFQISLYAASLVEAFTQGLGAGAFGAFLMNLCDRSHAATQYALLSAGFAFTRDTFGAFSGIGVERLGYAGYFVITACLALPALLLLPAIRGRIREGDDGDPPLPAIGDPAPG